MKNNIYLTLNVLFITTIVSLAVSHASQLIDFIPDLNFLEAAGVYCIWIPIHSFFTTYNNQDN
jgi:hypothetical protein